jgi:hypothetical protein
MISITRKKFGISINEIYFAEKLSSTSTSATLRFYVQAKHPHPNLVPFKTQVVDLTKSTDSLSKAISKSTHYKIKRAEREGFSPRISLNPTPHEATLYALYYDTFATQKKLPLCNRVKLRALATTGSLILSSVSDQEGNLLAAHAYVKDGEIGRARLLYSASHFRGLNDPNARNKIGMANRLLHWFEILSLKQEGLRSYDLGGIPLDETDKAKMDIARFKLEFGGEPVIEYNGFIPQSQLGRLIAPFARRR